MLKPIKFLTSAIATVALAFAGLTAASVPANAAVILNANGVALKFNENNQVVDVIAGTTGSNRGTAVGDIVAYRTVANIGGTNIDAAIETIAKNGATIGTYDGTSAVSGANDYFQTNVNTSGAGDVVFKFSFYVGGTYTGGGSGTPVILQNVYINSYDLDRSSPGDSQQFTQFTGVQAYTLANNNALAVSATGNLLQFVSTAPSGTNYSATSGSYTKGRVQVRYDNLTSISIKIGTDATGSGGLSYYALDFSVGLPWTEGSTTIQTTTTTNGFNSPPTSTNDTKSATASVPELLTSSDFGTYADPDLNPEVSVKIVTLPAGGTLQYYNGSAWVAVTAGQVVTIADIDANKLRYTANANTTSDSFTFKVSDGLLDSTAAYTQTITVTPGAQVFTAQTITYNQPLNQMLSTGSLTVAPTATSGLTVTLTSSTPSVCTVSGFVITFVSTGTCTTTASQPGDSTYSAATDVTRSFNISTLTPQNITYNQPLDQLLSTGSLTVSPTASSGLTVTLTSSTPSVCTVSGFVITFVGNGTCTTTASQPGDSTYAAATNVTRSFNITTPAPVQPVLPAAPALSPVSGKTITTTPITLPAPANSGTAGGACLIDPVDSGCKGVVVIAGKGTFTLGSNGQTTFQAVAGFYGTVVVDYRVTDGYARSATTTVTVEVLRPQPLVLPPSGGTTTINKSITVNPFANLPGSNVPGANGKGNICLVDPADNVCKGAVDLPGKGRFVLNPDGSATFTPVPGFIGEAKVQLRVTDEYGQSAEAPVIVVITDTPGAQNGQTKGSTPVILPQVAPPAPGDSRCLIDPTDGVCKNKVSLPGVGTWTQNTNGTVAFVASPGYIGSTTVMQRFTRAALGAKLSPYTVTVAKKRGPVTITISGFADGSPVLTAAIKAKINAFMRAHADYKNLYCIGYTEGPTVLATDKALSKQRAVNACGFVKAGLGKKLVVRKMSDGQGVIEADKFRRITITLTD